MAEQIETFPVAQHAIIIRSRTFAQVTLKMQFRQDYIDTYSDALHCYDVYDDSVDWVTQMSSYSAL